MPREESIGNPKCSCGKPVSKPGGLCKSCGFANAKFKEKSCTVCGVSFVPKSGIQKDCEKCKFTCPICGGEKVPGSKHCAKCTFKHTRKFNRVCQECGDKYKDSNNRSRYCEKCNSKINTGLCVDCGNPVSTKAKRCNTCNAYFRNTNFPPKGWKKYEFNGVKYRSKWEIAFAEILTACDIDFKYELFHQGTGTRPDFYITKLDRYIEIHPDHHGTKAKLPENCILVKTLSHARAAAFSIAYKLNKDKAVCYEKRMSWQARSGMYKISLDLAVYLRGAIFERDGK